METKSRLKVCFYSPYIPTSTGGGEKHILDIAEIISKKADVYFALADISAHHDDLYLKKITQKYEQFLNKDLSYIKWIASPLGTHNSFYKKLLWTKQFDYLFYVTDGSLFFSLAKHNILHIQVPLLLEKNSLIEKLKLKNWQHINVNSYFTRNIIERSWDTAVDSVIYPVIDTTTFTPETKKTKIILNVGRFFQHLHSKRQDIALDIFKLLYESNQKKMKDWKLVFIGPIEDAAYVRDLHRKARNLPIEFHHNLKREELITFYNKASIFWHTAGYGVNQTDYPEKVEHFGISTVEAMAAGCVPLVLGKGGQIEVLGEDLKELLWQRKEELIDKTSYFISNPAVLYEYKQKVKARSQFFGVSRFKSEVLQLFDL